MRPRNVLKLILTSGLVVTLALGAAEAAPRRTAAPSAPTAPSAVASGMGAVTVPPEQRLAAALNQIGLGACSSAVLQAGRFLFEDGEANFTVQPIGPDANRWPTVIIIEGAHARMGRTRLSTLTIAPGQTCSGFYEQVIYWDQPCADLKRTVFATFKDIGVLLKNVQVSELNPGLQLYLTPAGKGCTSVKKELFH